MAKKKPHQENSDPEKLRIAEGIGRRTQRDAALRKSGTAQGMRSQEIRPGQCSTENSERTDVWDETLERPGKQQGMTDRGRKQQLRGNERINNPGIRRLLRLKIEDIRGARQKGFWTGVCKVSIRNLKRDTKNQRLDLVEGSIPSKTKKKKKKNAQIGGACNIEHRPPTQPTELTGLYRVLLRTSTHKEGAVAVVGE
jgi:hypothetical protein